MKGIVGHLLSASLLLAGAACPAAETLRPALPAWDMAALSQAPAFVETDVAKVEGVRSLFIDGLPYRGKPTRFYAYLGFPKGADGKVPAVVLVHGGGGTAFADWVKYWNDKGYAALAMDNEGQVPVNTTPAAPPAHWQTIDSLGLPWGGAPQRTAAGKTFGDDQAPLEDQWAYHGVAECVLAVSLLASRPEVDAGRIGIVGISMGSILCSVAGAIDPRLAFVVPQYIGGHWDLGNVWYAYLRGNPSVLPDAARFYAGTPNRAHWLWINGINDKYGLPPMTTASWHDTGPDSWMCLLPTLGHSTFYKESGPNAVREIYAFADSVTRGTPPLARILRTVPGKGQITLDWKADPPIVRACLAFTTDPIPLVTIAGEPRKDWEHVRYTVEDIALPPVAVDPGGTARASFPMPDGMTAGFINLIDARGLSVSGDFMDLSAAPGGSGP